MQSKSNSPGQDSGSDPWRYCIVCSRHHNQGRKHIFTTKHKNKLTTILNKFSEKVRSARQQVQKPGVMEGELEPDSTLWCYFCQLEVARHVTDRLTTVVWGGLLEHMASPSHHKNTRRFWWLNGADKKHLQNFLLFEAEYKRYKELVAVALEELETTRELKRKEEVRRLQAKEESQALAAASEPPAASQRQEPVRYVTVRNKHGVLQNPTGLHEGGRVWGGGILKYKTGSDQLLPWPIDRLHSSRTREDGTSSSLRGKVTVAATGDTLTSINPPRLQEGQGNVHSGATPPWLMTDSCDDDDDGGGDDVSKETGGAAAVLIGPSEEEFLRHKEQGKRKGRKGMVGADFHLKLGSSFSSSQLDSNWLPSFGRVWNTGPRSHSLAEFKREKSSSSHQISPAQSASAFSNSTIGSPFNTASDRPGPSGLHLLAPQTQTTGSGITSASLASPAVPNSLPVGVALEDIRPYVRKRKGKSNHQDSG